MLAVICFLQLTGAWVVAAGRSEAEPQIAEAALAELCQTYWAPLYGFVRQPRLQRA